MADEKKTIGPEAVKPAEAPAQGQADPVKAAPPEQASPPTPGKVVDFAAAREEAAKDKAAAQKAGQYGIFLNQSFENFQIITSTLC